MLPFLLPGSRSLYPVVKLAGTMNALVQGVGGPQIVLSNAYIDESASNGTTIGNLSVVGGTGSWTFSETADPDSKFGITGSNLNKTASLAYATKPSHTVTIQATNGTDTISRVIPIYVMAVPAQIGSGDWSVADLGTNGDALITISVAPDARNSAITSYQYQVGAGSWTTLGSTIGAYPISGLTDGSAANIGVRAVNAIGNGTGSATKSVTSTGIPDAFVDANWSIAGANGKATVTVASNPASNGSAITSIQYSKDGGSWTASGIAGAGSFDISGTNGVSMSVQLRAVNANGTGASGNSESATPSAAPAFPLGLVAEGDSLTEGQSVPGKWDYPLDLGRNVGLLVQNFGHSGDPITAAISDYASSVGPAYNALTADALLFMMGTNDAGSVNAATILSRIQSYLDLAKAGTGTGYRIALGTIPKRGDNPTAQAVIDTVNVSLRANYLAMGATWLMDLDLWPTLQNPNDTTYYNADKLHFSKLGYRELGLCAQSALGMTTLPDRGSNGALRFRSYPPGWRDDEVVNYGADMMSMTMNGSNSAVLITPITGKKVFAFTFPAGVNTFTATGVHVEGDDTANPGFGSANGGAALYNNGLVFAAGGGAGNDIGGFTNGDTVGVVVDVTAKKIWWTKDGTNFGGVNDDTVSFADVVAGLGTDVQAWNAAVYGFAGGFGGGLAAQAQSVLYPWTIPTGFSQL